MKDNQIKLVIGSLLHDIGKVVYRTGSNKTHSQEGYDFLKSLETFDQQEILGCVRYHHASELKNADLNSNDLAYITYFADNIAAATDRREGLDSEDGFDRKIPLASVFNVLNQNSGKAHYAQHILKPSAGVNYPTEEPVSMDEGFYSAILDNIRDNLKGISISEEYVNSLLAILEANLSYIPSSTSMREQADISLYDHLKLTAALASCILLYEEAEERNDYKEDFFLQAEESYDKKMILLYSMDLSGIQKFIYTIRSEGALRNLRSRSFYLDIVMENIIDELLDRAGLSRANLIYSGGGHCYLLLPNTAVMKQTVDLIEQQTNEWFMNQFGIALYLAGGYAECSANDLENKPNGSYSALYRTISDTLSQKKGHRYTADQIRYLNSRKHDGERECQICKSMRPLDEHNLCPICAAIERMSKGILYYPYFAVTEATDKSGLPLPFGRELLAVSDDTLRKLMESPEYVRCYAKNEPYSGKFVATHLWVGSYSTGDTFEEYAEKADGIKRIGVLRADVDNLGATFVSGFTRQDGDRKYATLSRTATLSRQLSLFFKCYINHICEYGESDVLGGSLKRNVAIVYSGGDDIFLVGSWNDVIMTFMDLRKAFRKYTLGTLSISGGVGMFSSGYPINIMARDVEKLESDAKDMDGKDAITLFSETTFKWDDFLKNVLDEKFSTLQTYMKANESKGNSFLYRLLELLRNSGEVINRARFVYYLARLEPLSSDDKELKDLFRDFSKKMYQWYQQENDRQELIAAIYLYVYLNRETEVAE